MRAARRPRLVVSPPIVAAVVATMVLWGLYLVTAAPDLTFWDASEFMTAAHTLGVPHPPGTPLWVLMGRVATLLFGGATPARAVTLLSVAASALAGGLTAWMVSAWIGARAAVATAVMAGTMYSLWNNATETEVYAVALLCSLVMLAAGEYAGREGTPAATVRRLRGLLVFCVALAVPLHQSVLVALPGAIALAWRGPRPTRGDLVGWAGLLLLGLSAVAVLPLRSAQMPALDAGHPISWQALLSVLRREQYAVAGLWPRVAPWWLQIANVFEWADWQVAFGLNPTPFPSVARTGLTLLWGWLGALGLRRLWQVEARLGRGMLALWLSGTVGVSLWLNLHAGPTFGAGVLPPGALHEARERDYFFVLGFWSWAVLAGVGLSAIVRALGRRWPQPAALLPLLLAAVPLVANRPVTDRRSEPMASLPRTYARLLLEAVPVGGVLVTAGDNDTFPLWYLQQVEALRTDVTLVAAPLLPARWYREELVRRGLLPQAAAGPWPGSAIVFRALAGNARRAERPLRVSSWLAAADRNQLDPSSGWALEGLVYAPVPTDSAGMMVLDLAAMHRTAEQVPPSALAPLPPWADPAGSRVQQLLRCAEIRGLSDPLLVSGCGGP